MNCESIWGENCFDTSLWHKKGEFSKELASISCFGPEWFDGYAYFSVRFIYPGPKHNIPGYIIERMKSPRKNWLHSCFGRDK